MAGKRKVHIKTSLSVPTVKRTLGSDGTATLAEDALPPDVTVVKVPPNPSTVRSFDFGPFYGNGIDEVTYAFQRQIERFLLKQDGEREVSTVVGYLKDGINTFLPYLILRSSSLGQNINLSALNRDVIDGYLRHLSDSAASHGTQRLRYNGVKSVMTALGQRGLITLVASGDDRTFPGNPFPNSARHRKGETPLSRKERQDFTAAVKTAVMPLFNDDVEPTSELLGYALLIVALHSGRNTTPLLEMAPDCLRAHPKDNTHFLFLRKRRGHNTSKVAIREDSAERDVEAMPGVRLPASRLIKRVIELAAPLRADAPPHLADRIWLYRSSNPGKRGEVASLTNFTLFVSITKLVKSYNLMDASGNPLRVNISRLRKTFANRIFELLDHDLASTAIALGNTPRVAGTHYLAPNQDSQQNWKFMGEVLTHELLNGTLGSTERTPAGSCTDPRNGQYAPKRDGKTCFEFLNCLRCRNYVVTGNDLYKLFSFYWRVLRERDRMHSRQWKKLYAHIPRLIDRDVIAKGIANGSFLADDVRAARDLARSDPHPFWRLDAIASLDEFRERDQMQIEQ